MEVDRFFPDQIVSDSRPQFTSKTFGRYSKQTIVKCARWSGLHSIYCEAGDDFSPNKNGVISAFFCKFKSSLTAEAFLFSVEFPARN